MTKRINSIKILFEDSDILAIAKPVGIAVHGDGKNKEKTIVDWLLKKYPKIKNVGEPILLADGRELGRAGIVHRLDKDTSGVLLLAKTKGGYEHLKAQFKNREIKKTYHAFLYGKLRDDRGMVDKPIGRAVGSIRKWATGARARGEMRDALTRYKVLKFADGISFVEVWPETGRTHQIRVHMGSLGHPVVSDALYAPSRRPLLGFSRQALHASKIVFTDLAGEIHEITAPFPEDFLKAREALGFAGA